MCHVPLSATAAAILSPTSMDAAKGFSVNTGTPAFRRSGTSTPCRLNGCDATIASSFSFASISV